EPTPDAELTRINERQDSAGLVKPPAPIVFEGNVPADLRKCAPLAALLSGAAKPPILPVAWLGEAISIKDPTSITFPRHSGSNALIVGHQEEAALSTLAAAALGLCAWGAAKRADSAEAAQFILLD